MQVTWNGNELGCARPANYTMRNSQACRQHPATAAEALSPRAVTQAGGLLFVLMAGAFLPLADSFIVNVALPTIDKSLQS
jgi:hypothetical protein